MFFRILANEHVRICKRSVLWISAGVLAALLLVQTVSDYAEAGGAPGGTPEFVSPEMQERIHQAAPQAGTWPTALARALE